MPEICNGEIERAIRNAALTGDILLVPYVARAIASQCGGSPRLIAEALTLAGIKAGVTMQFGTPE